MRMPTIMNDFFKARSAIRKEVERSGLQLSLVKAFYEAEPESLSRKGIISELKAISKDGPSLTQKELNALPERKKRLIEEFGATPKPRPPISRESLIDSEINELMGHMGQGVIGTAKAVIIDRMGTLSTERSFRMARPSFHTRQKYLDKALNPAI